MLITLGGGQLNSLSILELFDLITKLSGIEIKYTTLSARKSDQKVFIADLAKLNSHMPFSPKINKKEGILKMFDWVKNIKT